MPNPGECCYKILQVTKFSTDKEIKASFLKLAKLHHPDLNRLNRQDHKQDSKEFRRIHEAYMTLKDANLRRIYDTNIAHEESLRSQYPYHTASSTYTSAAYGYQHQQQSHNYDPMDVPRNTTRSSNSSFVVIGAMVSLFIAAIILWPASSTTTSSTQSTHPNQPGKHGQVAQVEAWWNPTTGRWEAPAPWDPEFIKNKHSMRKVDRQLVFRRTT